MKIKALLLSLSIFISVALSGCAYDECLNNLKLFDEFLQKILYFYQFNGGGGNNDNGATSNESQSADYLEKFTNALSEDMPFIITKTIQTNSSQTQETIYYTGDYIYKVSKVENNTTFVSHKLYLKSGLTYTFNGDTVSSDKQVDFNSTKKQMLSHLFNDSIIWEKKGDGYTYKDSDTEFYLEKGEKENSINYEIRYLNTGTLIVHSGEVVLQYNPAVEMPAQIKQYI